MMHIRIKRSGVREVTHRFILGNQQDIGIRVRDRFKNVRIKLQLNAVAVEST